MIGKPVMLMAIIERCECGHARIAPHGGSMPTKTGLCVPDKFMPPSRHKLGECVAAERERCAAVARRWGETHEPHVAVNARNAADKIARAIEGPNS